MLIDCRRSAVAASEKLPQAKKKPRRNAQAAILAAASVPSGSSGSRRAFYAEGIDLWEGRWIEARGCRWIVAPAETLRFDMVFSLYIDFRCR
jgi:hypothetical protein